VDGAARLVHRRERCELWIIFYGTLRPLGKGDALLSGVFVLTHVGMCDEP
jgi:hypothetical protein